MKGDKLKSFVISVMDPNLGPGGESWQHFGEDGKVIFGCSEPWPNDPDAGHCDGFMNRYDLVANNIMHTSYRCYDAHCEQRVVDYQETFSLNSSDRLTLLSTVHQQTNTGHKPTVCTYLRE